MQSDYIFEVQKHIMVVVIESIIFSPISLNYEDSFLKEKQLEKEWLYKNQKNQKQKFEVIWRKVVEK